MRRLYKAGRLLFVLALLAPSAAAQQTPAATVADFSWLEGAWRGELDGRTIDQQWSAPRAGLMMGMFRLVEGERTLVLEFFSLRETPEGIDFRVRHFSPALEAWEKGDPIILKLAGFDGTRAAFENPVHGRPKRSFLIRTGPDSFTSRSEIERPDGTTATIEVFLTRANAPTPSARLSGRDGCALFAARVRAAARLAAHIPPKENPSWQAR